MSDDEDSGDDVLAPDNHGGSHIDVLERPVTRVPVLMSAIKMKFFTINIHRVSEAIAQLISTLQPK